MTTMSIKLLADGQLPNAKGTLYTVPGSTTTIIKTITYVNTDSSARAVNLYVKDSARASRRIIPMNMTLGIGYLMAYDNELTLEAGDLIEGDADVEDVVDYTVNGVEKS